MKRGDLLRHIRRHGCYLKREGVPRHNEISDSLARKICRGLSVPAIGK
ncbi:MAG: addiction module toxin, HicA family [Deltaproteobacteria bacterium]|nr:MAG: addiction module toxin, HicA family [Deltaproteobacteria bacterium]